MRNASIGRLVRAALIPTLAILALGSLVVAQEEIAAGKPPQPPGGKNDGPQRFAKVEDVTKDMQAMPGLFTLYRFDPEDKNRDPEKLLAQIPAKLLDEDLLFATTISSGGSYTGWMWTNYLFRWHVAGNQLKMVVPDTRYITPENDPVQDVVRRTYGARYVASLPILSMTPQGDVIVNLGQLLKSDIAGVRGLGGQVRPDLSTWTKIKVFPDNMLIEADLALARGLGGTSVGVAYAFQRLPRLGSYTPREADQRVGYFTTARLDWSKAADSRDMAERYINRWHLEKRDPSLELSPPKKPIMFIVEKTVPIRWRRWVRQGIEDWNKAFEKIGFVDAIVVQQQTEDNEYADYDPEDSRYNFIRWTVTGRALAVGPSCVDPRTGQILDADVVVDDGWIRHYLTMFDTRGPLPVSAIKGPGFERLLEEYPDFVPEILHPAPDALPNPLEARAEMLGEDQGALGACDHAGCACAYAEGLRQQLALAHYAAVATGGGREIPERLLGEAVRELVTHEVGHTLGLRHNFKGSAWLSLDEVRERRDTTDGPLSSSIMDYNPLLFFEGDKVEEMRHMVTPTIGPYDEWAIEYGYVIPDKGKAEAEALKAIASRCAEPALTYATDEDTIGVYSTDPASNRYDMSSDPLAWAQSQMDVCQELMKTVTDWAAKKDEPRYHLRKAVGVLLSEQARNYEYVARVVGGQYFYRDYPGDPDARPAFVLVDGPTQRAALKLMNERLFTSDFGKLEPELLNMLAPSRWMDWAGSGSIRQDYPIHDNITYLQMMILVDLLSPPVLQRVYDAELKSNAPDKFTAAELVTSLRDAVWSQLGNVGDRSYTDADPFIPSVSRNLQRQYLNSMLSLAQSRPGSGISPDLTGMIRFALRELSDKIGNVLESSPGRSTKLDFATRAHLTECKSRIDRALDAQYIAR